MRQAVVPSRPAVGQFRFRHFVPGDRTHQTRHGTGTGSAPRAASGRQVHPDHPQYPYVADTQPLARQGIQSRPTPQPARQRLCVGGSPRCFRQRTNHGILRKNRRGVRRITRFDVLDLQHRLPRWMLQLPYDLLNRLNRRRLLRDNDSLTRSITMEDYRIGPVADDCFDLFYIAEKQHK